MSKVLNLEELVEQLSKITVMEAAKLSKMLEEHWGVSAAAPMMAAPMMAAAVAEVAKTSFDVILTSFGDKKLEVVKAIKDITGLPLTESKALVESAPKAVKSGVTQTQADEIKAKLESVGAKVEIK